MTPTAVPSYAEVDAGVRRAIAAYTQALDDGRTDDVVATFCPDATVEIPGMGTHEGVDAIRAAYAQWTPRRPQRHLVLNTLVAEWTADEAHATSDVVFLLKGKEGWAVQVVGRYEDVLHRDDADGRWRFHARRATFLD
ncbi:MAG TPA: nuclear transport factor 2 family protein [Acidimicrobiales bacterium]|nr:nuclear transport factor 2 family protein [Acidimicrobiales bacterium]